MTDATLMGAKPSFVAPSQPLEKSLQELIQGRGCQLDDSELQPFAMWSQFWQNLTCQLVEISNVGLILHIYTT